MRPHLCSSHTPSCLSRNNCRALGFNPGFMPDVEVSPYVKLLPMLAGIGSPGTVQEVGCAGLLGGRPPSSWLLA